LAYEAEGRLQEAISDYDLALRIDPNDAETYLHRGDAWFGLAEFDRAIHDSTEALQLAPDYG
jgi:tetratricopeptide (TPR) repeat protein